MEPGDDPYGSALDPAPTGRLFRSRGASGSAAEQALPALDSPSHTAPDRRRGRQRGEPLDTQIGTGLSGATVVLLVAGVTILIAFANVIATGDIGWPTGIALVITSLYAAVTVRPRDGYWALVSPPLAFFAATVTAGQLTVTGSGSFFVQQGLLIPLTLGQNVGWILAATLAAGLTVWLRRRKPTA